jgi:hypothetical protein
LFLLNDNLPRYFWSIHTAHVGWYLLIRRLVIKVHVLIIVIFFLIFFIHHLFLGSCKIMSLGFLAHAERVIEDIYCVLCRVLFDTVIGYEVLVVLIIKVVILFD